MHPREVDEVVGDEQGRGVQLVRELEDQVDDAGSAELFVGDTTVKSHLAHIFSKLGVGSRTAAVSAARQRGILRREEAFPYPTRALV